MCIILTPVIKVLDHKSEYFLVRHKKSQGSIEHCMFRNSNSLCLIINSLWGEELGGISSPYSLKRGKRFFFSHSLGVWYAEAVSQKLFAIFGVEAARLQALCPQAIRRLLFFFSLYFPLIACRKCKKPFEESHIYFIALAYGICVANQQTFVEGSTSRPG